MRKFSKTVLAALALTVPFSLAACSSDEDDTNGGTGGSGMGGAGTGGDSSGTGGDGTGGDGTGGDGGEARDCEFDSDSLYCIEDCAATGGPSDFLKASGTGAFSEESDWMDGWTNWSIDSSGVGDDAAEEIIDADIDADMTLTADKVWGLKNTVHVLSGATLTIEPGTVIKGDSATNGALVISRGGKINAVGTADKPIVFTSAAADGAKEAGQWGGVILLGKAPNFNEDDPTIEGLPDGTDNQYGGDDPADNSGEMKYVRIEFGGSELAPDKEINGLTLGSVGSGTKLSYIQVNTTLDDGFEWFGGGMDAHHLVVNNAGDDMFDIDQGFQGSVKTIFGRQVNPATDDPNGFEWDSDVKLGEAGVGATPVTTVEMQYGTLCGTGALGKPNYGAVLRENIRGTIDTLTIMGFDAAFDTRDDFIVSGTTDEAKIEITNSTTWYNIDGLGLEETDDDDDDFGFDEAAWFTDGSGNTNLD